MYLKGTLELYQSKADWVAITMDELHSSTTAPPTRADAIVDLKTLLLSGAMVFLHLSLIIIIGTLFPYLLNLQLNFGNFYLYNLISQLIYPYTFILAPALLFLIIYRFLSKHVFERISSVLTSVILGCVIGAWLGSIFVVQAIPLLNPGIHTSIALTTIFFFAAFDIAIASLAFFAPGVAKDWDTRLKQEGLTPNSTKPEGILTIVLIFILAGIFTIGLLPVVALLFLSQSIPNIYPVLEIFLPFIAVTSLTLVVIGYGIRDGRRWGWLLALLSSALGSVATLSLWYSLLVSMTWVTFLGFVYTLAALSSFGLNILAIALLLSHSTRIYCRMINVATSDLTLPDGNAQAD